MMTGGGALGEKGTRSLGAVVLTLLLLRQTVSTAIYSIIRRCRLTAGSFFAIATHWVLGNRPQVVDVPHFIANTYRCSDRAAVQTTAILQIFETAPPQDRRQAIENYLRDELSDAVRQAIADREATDA
jgi:hypothetical protein